jgi:hypothetical protein
MKNQLDLIICIACIVLAGIFAGIMYATKPQVAKPPAPTQVNTAALSMPAPEVKYAHSLPGGMGGGGGAAPAGRAGGGGGGGGGGRRGGKFGGGG